ncbi:MAG: ABC transporter permease [Candidatus Rokubacteria bacterium]|nr:ABC transporter permease [Candidatus Rokubacteria bacterium]
MVATAVTRRPRPAAVRRVVANRSLCWGVLALTLVAGAAGAAPILAPFDPLEQHLDEALQPPSGSHPLGTDNFGRDILSRTLHGARVDLAMGVGLVVFPLIIGTPVGCVAGYRGGLFDSVVMRVAEIAVAFPFFVLVIGIIAMLGPGLSNMYLGVTIVSWVSYARIARGEMLTMRELDYVQAARALGLDDSRIVFRHLLPGVVSAVVLFAVSDVVLCILLGTSLSFLGLGVQPPTAEWGAMIADGRNYILTAWWMPTFPGLAIALVGVTFSLLGDGLAHAFRPGR